MKVKLLAMVAVTTILAILLASALNTFPRISDSALAQLSPSPFGEGRGEISSRPSTAGKNYLPTIFLNSATAGGAWLLGGNAGTNWATDFLGTTDNMTLTLRVSNTVAYRIIPVFPLGYGFSPNIISGSGVNRVSPGLFGATIAGGGSTPWPNVITGTGNFATIAGGDGNTASASSATVGGGAVNTANNLGATVGGGTNNIASGDDATVGGGVSNTASGQFATVPGGYQNIASGDYSLAAGNQAQALNQGAFVWADSTNVTFPSTGNDQFLIRASGGVGIGTNSPGLYALDVQRNGGSFPYQVAKLKNASASGDQTTIVDLENGNASSTLWRVAVGGAGNGLGRVDGQYYLERSGAGVAMQLDANRDAHFYPSLGGSCDLISGAAGWSCSSDRNLKENIVRASGQEILARVAELPVSTWNMKGSDVTHIGPMAQDFYAAFHVGEDDKHINTVDAQGVALAAIQGLAQENKAQAKELAELKERNERELTELKDLKAQNENLEARLVALEQIAGTQSSAANAFAWKDFAPWGVVGLIAVWMMRKRR